MLFRSGRTDVHAQEAWNRGQKGDGVIVAVIDNLIQWDHPALKDGIATVDCSAQKEVPCLPGESRGWDFSSIEDNGEGDNDTRISSDEVSALRPDLEESAQPDEYLTTKYAEGIARVKAKKPELSTAQILPMLRSGEFGFLGFNSSNSFGIFGLEIFIRLCAFF